MFQINVMNKKVTNFYKILHKSVMGLCYTHFCSYKYPNYWSDFTQNMVSDFDGKPECKQKQHHHHVTNGLIYIEREYLPVPTTIAFIY